MLQRKVKKAVAPYDDAVVGGLRELSEFYGPNTAAARRGRNGRKQSKKPRRINLYTWTKKS